MKEVFQSSEPELWGDRFQLSHWEIDPNGDWVGQDHKHGGSTHVAVSLDTEISFTDFEVMSQMSFIIVIMNTE